jgi:hypothetical protein
MHLPAERNGRNDKEKYEESHAGFLNELCVDPASSTVDQSRCSFRSPEKNLCSEN